MQVCPLEFWKAPRWRTRHIAFAITAATLLLPLAPLAHAQAACDQPVDLDRVVVTTRLEQVPAFDVPASLSVVVLGEGSHADVNLSEYLDGTPGLLARDRQNYAQDTQLSIRGYGVRSTFGVRGIRLYSDGIPATMPDGQGQISHFNLLGGDRIEVMRGPFSALYGNSSGGVIQLWSAAPTATPEFTLQSNDGPDGSWTLGGRTRGTAGLMGYNVAVQRFETDGYRDHSAATRTNGNAKLSFDMKQAGALAVVANAFDSPNAQDPLGLTWDQAHENPRQATSVAETYNTRKSIRQDQLGASYELSFGNSQALRALAYTGTRKATQYLALPPAAQVSPLNAGGVIDLDSNYDGGDLRWSWHGDLASRPLELSAGANFERQRQQRKGYENFIGSVLGVRGALRRDERDDVENFDQYAQAWWRFAPRWSLLAGARHSIVCFRSDDRYVTADNPDDSGSKRYSQTTPVAGLSFAATDDLHFYFSAGRGFETPTFNEIGYRSDGGAGLAFDLAPTRSRNLELGGKWRSQSDGRVEVALFRAETNDELGVARNIDGRSSYRNVGRARRQGMEIGAGLPIGERWTFNLAYTWLDATFRDAFPICSGNGCTDPTTLVDGGTRLPGTARNQLDMTLDWQGDGWNAGVEVEGIGEVTTNDQGSAAAPGYFLLNTRIGYRWRFARSELLTFVRIDNAADRSYIGSVIVNEGNGRYYEPAPGRSVNVGARWQWGRPD